MWLFLLFVALIIGGVLFVYLGPILAIAAGIYITGQIIYRSYNYWQELKIKRRTKAKDRKKQAVVVVSESQPAPQVAQAPVQFLQPENDLRPIILDDLSYELLNRAGLKTYDDSEEEVIRKYFRYAENHEADHLDELKEYLANKE